LNDQREPPSTDVVAESEDDIVEDEDDDDDVNDMVAGCGFIVIMVVAIISLAWLNSSSTDFPDWL
jgi:hypothetical protein